MPSPEKHRGALGSFCGNYISVLRDQGPGPGVLFLLRGHFFLPVRLLRGGGSLAAGSFRPSGGCGVPALVPRRRGCVLRAPHHRDLPLRAGPRQSYATGGSGGGRLAARPEGAFAAPEVPTAGCFSGRGAAGGAPLVDRVRGRGGPRLQRRRRRRRGIRGRGEADVRQNATGIKQVC